MALYQFIKVLNRKKMKKKFVLALLSSFFFVAACKDHNMDMLNINYPAVYVVSGQDNYIDVVNLNNGNHEDHIELNGATFPHHIYFNSDKSKMAVAITSTDLSAGHAGHGASASGYKIMIINAVTGMTEKELPLSKMPHNAVFSPNGNELWVGQSDTTQSQILVYRTNDWSVQNTINVGRGLSEITFSVDGSMAFACNTTDGTVSMISPSDKSIHNTIAVGQNPVGAWPADNGKMYVDNEASQSISEISVAGMNITETIVLNYTPAYVAYHSASQELWISDASNGKIHYYSYNLAMSMWMQTGEFSTGANAHAIAFANNGKAYISNQNANTLSIVDIASHTVEQNINVGAKPNGLAIKQ